MVLVIDITYVFIKKDVFDQSLSENSLSFQETSLNNNCNKKL